MKSDIYITQLKGTICANGINDTDRCYIALLVRISQDCASSCITEHHTYTWLLHASSTAQTLPFAVKRPSLASLCAK